MRLRPLSNRDAIQSWMRHWSSSTPTLESERRSRIVGRDIDPESCDYGSHAGNGCAAPPPESPGPCFAGSHVGGATESASPAASDRDRTAVLSAIIGPYTAFVLAHALAGSGWHSGPTQVDARRELLFDCPGCDCQEPLISPQGVFSFQFFLGFATVAFSFLFGN